MHSGLGELLSTTFAKQGCNIAINYFNRIEPAQDVQRRCQEEGVKAVVIKAVRSSPSFALGPALLLLVVSIML